MSGLDGVAAIEAAQARIDDRIRTARDAAAAARTRADEVRAVSATAVSPRREVRVTARADGAVVQVELLAAAADLDLAELSQVVTTTVAAAQRDALDHAARWVGESATEARTSAEGGR